ncbi:MAG: MFS transporter [Acidimicrobiales bacterium]|nr:MFS transporter [Acidimicrobiales bacterium]
MFQKGSANKGARSPSGFYGWHMLALASLVGILTGPGQSAAVSVFREHLSSGLDLSDSAIATAYLVGTLTSSVFQPRIGTWVDSVGVKRATITVGVLFAIAVAHMSLIHGVVWLAVGFLGIRILGQGALSLTSTVAVAHWFNLRRGFAMGLKTTVTFSGMSAIPLILALTIEAWGWREAWLIAAVTILITVVPIAFFGYVDRPSDLGQVPDGGKYEDQIVSDKRAKSVTRDVAIRTRTFWTLASVTICSSLFGTGLIFHQSNILGEIGYSNSEAAAMFLPTAVGSILGGLGFGWLADRSIRPWLPGTSAFLIAATTFLGGSVTSFGGVICYVLLFGLAMGGVASLNTALLPALFGVGHIGSITGSLSFLSVLASSIGALAYSLGSNVFGDYRSTSVAFTLVPLFVACIAMINRRHFLIDKDE